MNKACRQLKLAGALFVLLVAPALAHAAKSNPHAELECTFCHEETPRFGVDTRATVTFWRAEGDEPHLCERCHGPETNFHPLGITPGADRMGTSPPRRLPLGTSEAVRGQVVCTTCHFVHAANADFSLLRGFPGSDRPNEFSTWQELCRECHGKGLEQRSPHAGDDRACAFCHSARPQPGKEATVTPVGRKLCEFCHGHKDEEHYAGINPFPEPQDCAGCHDPHLGKGSPARLVPGYFDPIRSAATLNPHRKRTLCFACHGDGRPEALAGTAVVAVCQRCHGSGEIPGMSHPMTKVPAGYAIPAGWPLAGGIMTCATCHLPGHPPGGAAGSPDERQEAGHLLRGPAPGARNDVCFQCHARSQWAGLSPHRDAAQKKTGCTLCHSRQPVWGRDTRATVQFVADVNIVCLACHDTPDHPASVRHMVTLKAGMPAVPETMPLGTGNRITCGTCHNPHLDTPDGHRLRGAKEPGAFCARCHKL